MIFAILFVLAFVVGLLVYLLSNRWLYSIAISSCLFIATTLTDFEPSQQWVLTLIFGLPIVFMASLFGAYVVEWRRGYSAEQTEQQASSNESE